MMMRFNRRVAANVVLRQFSLVIADVPGTSLAELASRDDITYISDDKPVRAHAALVTESTGAAQAKRERRAHRQWMAKA